MGPTLTHAAPNLFSNQLTSLSCHFYLDNLDVNKELQNDNRNCIKTREIIDSLNDRIDTTLPARDY